MRWELMRVFLFLTAALQLTDNLVLALVAPDLSKSFWPDTGVDALWLLVAYSIGAAIGPISVTRFAPAFRGRRAIATGLAVLATVQLAFAFQPAYQVALALRALAGAEPIYETLPGWSTPTKGATLMEQLPPEARRYIERLEDVSGVHCAVISTGSGRGETIVRPNSVVARWTDA